MALVTGPGAAAGANGCHQLPGLAGSGVVSGTTVVIDGALEQVFLS